MNITKQNKKARLQAGQGANVCNQREGNRFWNEGALFRIRSTGNWVAFSINQRIGCLAQPLLDLPQQARQLVS